MSRILHKSHSLKSPTWGFHAGFGLLFSAFVLCFLAGRVSAANEDNSAIIPPSAGLAALPKQPAALDFTQVWNLWEKDPNLTGSGVRIASICPSETYINNRPQGDYRFNMGHYSLSDADVVFEDGSNGQYGLSAHATACAGILLGLDETAEIPGVGTFEYRGACPDASVDIYEFFRFASLYLFGKRSFNADIVTLSLGDIFEDWWTRGLEQAAAEKDFLVIAGIGNGTGVHTPKPLYPAAGSNVLGVGVVDSVIDAEGKISLQDFSTPKAIHSSFGPTEDIRCKPDIVAPGTALVPAHSSRNGYTLAANWSSLSAPIVSGTAALLWQEATSNTKLTDAFNQPGKALVIKAVLMNSARKLPFWHKGQPTWDDDHRIPLDFAQGAGLLDGLAAYNQLTAGAGHPGDVSPVGWDNRILNSTERIYEYTFTVTEPNQVITATLCWNRTYETQYPFRRIFEQDNDLRLELWATEPNEPSRQLLMDYSDSVNDNVEHIVFTCLPSFTKYTVRISFNESQSRDTAVQQQFALAWSAGMDRQADNPWWYDLNADDQVDTLDQLIYAILDNKILSDTNALFLEEPLKLSAERIELLTQHWSDWKHYLADWTWASLFSSDASAAIDAQDLAGDVAVIQ